MRVTQGSCSLNSFCSALIACFVTVVYVSINVAACRDVGQLYSFFGCRDQWQHIVIEAPANCSIRGCAIGTIRFPYFTFTAWSLFSFMEYLSPSTECGSKRSAPFWAVTWLWSASKGYRTASIVNLFRASSNSRSGDHRCASNLSQFRTVRNQKNIRFDFLDLLNLIVQDTTGWQRPGFDLAITRWPSFSNDPTAWSLLRYHTPKSLVNSQFNSDKLYPSS